MVVSGENGKATIELEQGKFYAFSLEFSISKMFFLEEPLLREKIINA